MEKLTRYLLKVLRLMSVGIEKLILLTVGMITAITKRTLMFLAGILSVVILCFPIIWGIASGAPVSIIILSQILTLVLLGLLAGIMILCANIKFIWATIEENHAIIVVKGDGYDKTLLAKKGWRMKDDGSEGIEEGEAKESLLTRWFGIYYIGIPFITRIYEYQQEWVAWKMEENDITYRAVHRKKTLWAVYLADYTYFIKVEGVETKDLIPFDFSFIVTARVVNPYKAVFVNHDWVRQMSALIQDVVIMYAGTRTFEQIVSEKSSGLNECITLIQGTTAVVPVTTIPPKTTMLESYGVEMIKTSIQAVDPAEQYRELTLKKTQAVRIAEAAVAEAEGDKKAREIRAQGEGNALTTIAEAQAKALTARANALAESGEAGKTLVNADVAQKLAENSQTTVITADSLLATIATIIGEKKKP